MKKRLYRSRTEKVIAGVCGGIGEYFDVDPTIIRLLAVASIFAGGAGILIYLICWIAVSKQPIYTPPYDPAYLAGVAAGAQMAAPPVSQPPMAQQYATPPSAPLAVAESEKSPLRRIIPGGALILLGAVLLLRHHFWWIDFVDIIPVLFIAVGLYFIFRRMGEEKSVSSVANSTAAVSAAGAAGVSATPETLSGSGNDGGNH